MSDTDVWNVISGGPSRKHLRASDLVNNAPVVTVNRAIDVIDNGITVDFAMFADSPEALVDQLGLRKYLVPPIQIWCPRPAILPAAGGVAFFDMVSRWEPFLPASVGIRTTPQGQLPDGDKTRYIFSLCAALERVLMFRPSRIRIISADMAGSWVPGMTEEECEMHQSELSECSRGLAKAQEMLEKSGGKDPAARAARDTYVHRVDHARRQNDPGVFKRWEYERRQLKVLEARANGVGCAFEYRTPAAIA